MELPTFTPVEWRMLAGACETLAEREPERAKAIGGREARDYVISAEGYERLAQRPAVQAAGEAVTVQRHCRGFRTRRMYNCDKSPHPGQSNAM